jgi:hypothetical protein
MLFIDKFVPNNYTIKNGAIEVDGIQHFQEGGFHYSPEDFITGMKRDVAKDKYCLENRISLLRIPYNMSSFDCKELIEKFINLSRSGYHVYFSYQHYYEEIIKTFPVDSGRILIRFVKCPPIKFKKRTK